MDHYAIGLIFVAVILITASILVACFKTSSPCYYRNYTYTQLHEPRNLAEVVSV